MRKVRIIVCVLLALAVAQLQASRAAAPTSDGDDPLIDTPGHKVSYGIAYEVGRKLKMQGYDELDLHVFMRGVEEGVASRERRLTPEQVQEAVVTVQRQIGDRNMAEGNAFLEANRRKDGVKTMPNGLQYKVLKQGSGQTPKPTDTVTANYRGTLIDGTVFDSSYLNGRPLTHRLDQLIPAWQQALRIMPVGSKWQLFVPPQLGYGASPNGPGGPNSVLIFEIELLKIAD